MTRTHAHRALATLLLLTLALAGCNMPDPAQNCREQGGQVITDESKYETKNGKRTVTIEYECIKDGQEIDEWKVTTRA